MSSIVTTWPQPTTEPTAPPAPNEPEGGHDDIPRGPWYQRLWRGPAADPRWARPAQLILLALTAAAYLWNLSESGWANAFYSAAAQAGSQSWSAFFFGSFDASNFITVDKTPASIWAMALSVRLFGLSSFAILLPQALMGVATVAVVSATVKRHFGAAAGLLSGATLALTPVAALMFRFNNPDALLTLLMALGAWATVRAIERGSWRWFALVGVFLGFGFLAKMLQVLLVVPGFGLAYLVAAPVSLRRRLRHALGGLAAMVASAGWWVLAVQLIPAADRPYIGGSQSNSIIDLMLGYNGFGRLDGAETGSVGGGGGWGSTGITRLFEGVLGGQAAWLLPAALVLLVVGLVLRAKAPRSDLQRAAYLVWGGWLVVTWLTFSFMAGIFHEYYTVALAPAIAALVGMGASQLWRRRSQLWAAAVLAAVVAGSALWAAVLLGRASGFAPGLSVAVVVAGLAGAAGLLLARRAKPIAYGAAAVSVVAVLAGPTAYTANTIATAHTGSIVTAGPAVAGSGPGGRGGFPGPGGRAFGGQGLPGQQAGGQGLPGGQFIPGQQLPGAAGGAQGLPGGAQGLPGQQAGGAGVAGGAPGAAGGIGGLLNATTPSSEVIAALQADASSYRWVAAAVGSQNAAGLQLGSGEPVMSIGGFNGTDPTPTLAQFQAYVAAGDIHYLLSTSGFGAGQNGSGTASQILSWAQSSYSSVTIGGMTFYDLTSPLSGATS